MINFILIFIILIAIGLGGYFWFNRKKEPVVSQDDVRFSIEAITQFVRQGFKELIKDNIFASGANLTAEEAKRRKNRRKELQKALRTCMHGDDSAKSYVKSYIKDMLQKAYGFDQFNINLVIPFDRPERLSDQDRFEILLHVFSKEHGKKAFEVIVNKYKLDEIRKLPDGSKGYRITGEDIKKVYEAEKPKLTFDDKLDCVIQRVYQIYKGHGVADMMRDQYIDGISGGVSGVPEAVIKSIDIEDYHSQMTYIPRSYDAVWIFYKGKSVHLEFLSFGSELELKRVVQNIYTNGNQGQLNEKKSFIVSDMIDGSRVVVVRPKMAASYAFFVRKHHHSLVDLKDQIKGKDATLPIQMIKYVVKGKQNTLFTGAQGSGKTTLIKGAIAYIEAKNIRFQELDFEIWANKLYPHKNILSFRETPTVSAQDGMDIQKKTDGTMNIVGEIASHQVAALAIQAGGIASEFTLGSYHGMTFPKTIDGLRASLIANGDFTDEKAAETQVVNWLNFDIHTVITGTGQRYIERITQCIPITETPEYPRDFRNASTLEGKLTAFMETMTDHFERQTNPKTYEYRDIIVWENDGYVVKEPITKDKFEEMARNMDAEDRKEFEEFVSTYWGQIV